MCKDDVLTRTRHTSLLLPDCHAIYADIIHDFIVTIDHVSENNCDNRNKVKKRFDGTTHTWYKKRMRAPQYSYDVTQILSNSAVHLLSVTRFCIAG